MKREIYNDIKNKRTKLRFGKAFCAVTAAAVAVFGFGSCAALEMLDKLAAEEDSANHTTTTVVAAAPAVDTDPAESSNAGDNKDENKDPAAPEQSSQGETENSSGQTGTKGQDTSSGSEGGALDRTESMLAPGTSPDSNGSGTAAPDSIVTDPGQPPQSQVPTDSSLFTDLTGSGTNSSSLSEGSGDLYTPGNFSSDISSTSNSSSIPDNVPANAVGGSQIYLAYSELVDKYASYVAKDPSFKAEFCRYYITDIDDNGVSEILIETGTIETDRTIYVYTFDGREAELLGNFVAWHTRLGDGPGVMYTETSAMGSYIVSTTRIQDGKLFTQREEQPFSESQITVPIIGYPYTNTAPLEALRG